jgi:hypothetical protein
MKDSEPLTGVKVTTICPALVNTPLITADKIKQFSMSEERGLSADEVAESMLPLIQEKKYGCGTVLEISKGGKRLIPEWNIDPPQAPGSGGNPAEVAAGQQALMKPIQDKLSKEKASKL